MDHQRKKEYIRQFVAEGVDLEQAWRLTYCTDDEIRALEDDTAFMDELQGIRVEVALRAVAGYRASLAAEGKPGDHLRRLQTMFPEAFRPEARDTGRPLDLNLTIVKQRGAGAG